MSPPEVSSDPLSLGGSIKRKRSFLEGSGDVVSSSSSSVDLGLRVHRHIGHLTERIIERLPTFVEKGQSWEMNVKEIVSLLDCGAQQVYTVFCVLESLLLITQMGRGTYRWNGFNHLEDTLNFLKFIAINLKIPDIIQHAFNEEVAEILGRTSGELKSAVAQIEGDSNPVARPRPKPKTPHMLTSCQKLMMVFIMFPQGKNMNLDFATKVVQGKDESFKRKLNEICNVLTHILVPSGLVKRPLVSEVLPRAPCRRFKYCGLGANAVMDYKTLYESVLKLPEYRKKHTYYPMGKALLAMPDRPTRLPGFKSKRSNEVGERDTNVTDQAVLMPKDAIDLEEINKAAQKSLKHKHGKALKEKERIPQETNEEPDLLANPGSNTFVEYFSKK